MIFQNLPACCCVACSVLTPRSLIKLLFRSDDNPSVCLRVLLLGLLCVLIYGYVDRHFFRFRQLCITRFHNARGGQWPMRKGAGYCSSPGKRFKTGFEEVVAPVTCAT